MDTSPNAGHVTGPRVEKFVLVAPNPAGSPVPAVVLEYLVEDDEVDGLAAAAAAADDAAAGWALLFDDDDTSDISLLVKNGVEIMCDAWR
jgi:hypothetical protein